ncbi:dispanin subfamily A member 2b-like [Denticeps clupeoides]|uniref:Interferon-induced transmembrane protein n=1 Tax=Denticeps clupeoides TaxID=299321 RepID=A0AAY4CLS5_9TELE|nr:dispanin subfamily A member 2b-like [Denticeps clupeoides]
MDHADKFEHEALAMESRYKRNDDTVVIVNAPTTLQPTDYVVWSTLNLMYCNPCCLGLLAFYYSIKSRDRKHVGDMEGAREYGSTARCLNIITLVLYLLLSIGFIIMIAILFPYIENMTNRLKLSN